MIVKSFRKNATSSLGLTDIYLNRNSMGKNTYQDHKGAEYKYSSGLLDICTGDKVHQGSKE